MMLSHYRDFTLPPCCVRTVFHRDLDLMSQTLCDALQLWSTIRGLHLIDSKAPGFTPRG